MQAFVSCIPCVISGSAAVGDSCSELRGGPPVESDVCVRESGDRGAQPAHECRDVDARCSGLSDARGWHRGSGWVCEAHGDAQAQAREWEGL